ncbi:hypothetical protein CO666_07260 [Rhizobium chutanense]|uniref:Uncharacterized protein n=1 Tax=Rhizobium chutanense TaxID=2035448 RepID=A0A2A6JGS9_9HYPH|nr:hypothetical protein CO666_07260 [Rhizobium chutanense]
MRPFCVDGITGRKTCGLRHFCTADAALSALRNRPAVPISPPTARGHGPRAGGIRRRRPRQQGGCQNRRRGLTAAPARKGLQEKAP